MYIRTQHRIYEAFLNTTFLFTKNNAYFALESIKESGHKRVYI